MKHLQLPDDVDSSAEITAVLSEVFQKSEQVDPARSDLPSTEASRGDYLLNRLLVAVGGPPVAIFLTFGIVVTPMVVIGGSPVALACSIPAGLYLLIVGLRSK